MSVIHHHQNPSDSATTTLVIDRLCDLVVKDMLYQITRCYIPGESTLHNRCCKNFTSNNLNLSSWDKRPSLTSIQNNGQNYSFCIIFIVFCAWGRSVNGAQLFVLIGYEVLTTMIMKISISWYIPVCGPSKFTRRFGRKVTWILERALALYPRKQNCSALSISCYNKVTSRCLHDNYVTCLASIGSSALRHWVPRDFMFLRC
jgi:hypothetical protein